MYRVIAALAAASRCRSSRSQQNANPKNDVPTVVVNTRAVAALLKARLVPFLPLSRNIGLKPSAEYCTTTGSALKALVHPAQKPNGPRYIVQPALSALAPGCSSWHPRRPERFVAPGRDHPALRPIPALESLAWSYSILHGSGVHALQTLALPTRLPTCLLLIAPRKSTVL